MARDALLRLRGVAEGSALHVTELMLYDTGKESVQVDQLKELPMTLKSKMQKDLGLKSSTWHSAWALSASDL